MPGRALYGASKIAPGLLVEVPTKEIGHRASRSTPCESLVKFNPLGRAGSRDGVANAVAFLLTPGAADVSGQQLLLSAGAPA
jgi:NAD(P)-dependent dehydrogenase (short-subunit alcohol dehydrogenase family)